MAASSKARVAKRIANKGKGKKASVLAAPEQKTTTDKANKIKWNVNAPLVRNAISFAVAQDTTVATAGVVGTASRIWDAIAKKQLSSDHSHEVLTAIEKAKHAALVAARVKSAKDDVPTVGKSTASDYKKIMDLAPYRCIPALTTTLLKIETLRVSHLLAIAKWMAGTGAKKGRQRAPGWKPEYTQAPPLTTLMRIAHKANERTPSTKGGKKGKLAAALKKHGVLGFPSKDTRKGAEFLIKSLNLFVKANPEMTRDERAITTGMLKSAETLAKSVAKRIAAARIKAAAAEAAASEK